MTSRYTKEGRTLRIERDLTQSARVTIEEHGVAETSGEVFECRPGEPDRTIPAVDTVAAIALADHVVAMIPGSLAIERLLVMSGVAQHRFESSEGDVTWSDAMVRVHVSITIGEARVRALFDFGAVDAAQLDVSPMVTAIKAMSAFVGTDAAGHSDVVLSPNVSAALIAMLALTAPIETAGMLTIAQRAHEAMPRDGCGRIIETQTLIGPGASRSECAYRPSYRVRPSPLPFHVRARRTAADDVVRGVATAVALTAPVEVRGEAIILSVLLENGTKWVVSRTAGEWLDSIQSVDESDQRWFPYSAGAWGGSMRIAGS